MKCYYLKNGETIGPVSKDELLKEININSWVKIDDGDWVVAHKAKELEEISSKESIRDDFVKVELNMKKIDEFHSIITEKHITSLVIILVIVLFVAKWWLGLIAIVLFLAGFTYFMSILGQDDLERIKRYLKGELDRYRYVKNITRILSIVSILFVFYMFNPDGQELKKSLKEEGLSLQLIDRDNMYLASIFAVDIINLHPTRRIYFGVLGRTFKVYEKSYIGKK